MALDFLVPQPQKLRLYRGTFPKPGRVRLIAPRAADPSARFLRADLRNIAGIGLGAGATFTVRLKLTRSGSRTRIKQEGYRLSLKSDRAEITARDQAGLFYGCQTLTQILTLSDPAAIPVLDISDWPEFRTRSFMVDLGRAPFSLAYLKRIVRILARLKMNTLHLHLNDDQLCGLKFRKLPLGRENPAAISLAQLGQLVSYARRYHVEILPEFECWGHAQSVIYHYPELYGGPGMWGGMSFGMGEQTFSLFERVFDELLPVLESKCQVHVGLDEAIWAFLPETSPEERARLSPRTLVGGLYDILQKCGKKHHRQVRMHLWADHGGRPISADIRDKVVVQPWNYFRRQAPIIRKKMRKYAGRGKPPMMMGGGMSSVCFGGDFGATRTWCQLGKGKPNVEGITICFWEDNDLAERIIGLYVGADYAWTPDSPGPRKNDLYDEGLRADTGRRMRRWQALFKDADAEALAADRGPHVHQGYYQWGRLAGKPVAPTVEMAKPDEGAAFG
jgi:Glycosyl hydrolase family 20, catalytic domain/Glycosyl hydrolase family 20, domain 2